MNKVNKKKLPIKLSKKFGLIVIGSFIAVFALAYFFLYFNISTQIRSLPSSSNLSQDLNNICKQIEFLKLFPETDNKSFNDLLVMRVLDTYIKSYAKFNEKSIIKLPKIEFFEYTEKPVFSPEISNQTDDKFFKDEKYRYSPGVITFSRFANFKLKIDDVETSQVEIELSKKDLQEYNAEVVGTLDSSIVIENIKTSFNNMIETIKKSDLEGAKQYVDDTNVENAIKQILSINNINEKVASLYPVTFDLLIMDKDNALSVGKLNIEQKSSTYVNSYDVIYDRALKVYKFSNLFDGLSQIPNPGLVAQISITPNQVQTISCSDCSLAPVDKFHALPSTYTPSVVNVTLPGGGQLTNSTISALNNLNNNAASKGIDITLISAFRSFQTQVATFNYWVGEQKKKGLSQADAEVQANKISARPGHSEHQLGTTLDLKCSTCGNFDNSPKNLALYQFLEQNAHTFGFVISYPKDKEGLTGYSYEPWHIRFIGIELATEFFDKNYLTGPNLSSTILLSQIQ
jgi:D-alanyl-D-alanine carboxypeptidase